MRTTFKVIVGVALLLAAAGCVYDGPPPHEAHFYGPSHYYSY